MLLERYHWQKRHPEAGGCRSWSVRGKTELSGRTSARLMALNRQVSPASPGAQGLPPPAAPPPHPCKASAAHAYWCIAGRMMDCALQGPRWWSLIILDGASRTRLAGALAPSEARGSALTGLSTAGPR